MFQKADPKDSMQKNNLKANTKDYEKYQDTLPPSEENAFM